MPIMVREIVLKTIREHNLIEANEHIVIGLSGGPDSVCLFHILNSLKDQWGLTLHPVHINHKLRPGAAEKDQAYVEELCRREGCPCRSFVYDCSKIAAEEGLTSEEAGRKARYESYAKVCDEVAAGGVPREKIKIALAHNLDDQAETVLFRILRGAGTDGIAGISYKRSDEQGNEIIRPLLDVPKAEVMAYCEENKLDPCIDKTNFEPLYARNRIRLTLLPYLEKNYNANIRETLVRMSRIAAADRECLRAQAAQVFGTAIKARSEAAGIPVTSAAKRSEDGQQARWILFDGDALRNMDKAIRMRVLTMAFGEIGLNEDISFTHLEAAEDIVFSDKPSARLDLPRGYYLTKVYNDVRAAWAPVTGPRVKIRIAEMGYKDYELWSSGRVKDTFAAFDSDALKEKFGEGFAKAITLRSREAGDIISLGGGKSKKVQDWFVDAKVPKDERDRVLIAAIGREALWIAPENRRGRYAADYRVGAGTKNVICIEIARDL